MATAHPEGQLKRQLKRKKKQAMRQARRAKGQAARAKDQAGRGQGQWVRSQDQSQDRWRRSIAGIRMRAKVTKAMGQNTQKSPESAARDELFKTII